MRLLLLLAPLSVMASACTATKPGADSGDSSPAAQGTGTLTAVALSPDEIAATVDFDGATVTCGAATASANAAGHAYVAGVTPGTTVSCTASSELATTTPVSVTMPGTTSAGVVLFDDDHEEQAGNADWIIDDDMPNPSPASPTTAEDWTGAYSDFGFAVRGLGYTVRTNTRAITTDTLADVQVLVLPEANSSFSSSELGAIGAFVQRGGGLILISNHHVSDRNGDGVEPTAIADDVLTAVGATPREASDTLDVDTEYNNTGSYGPVGDPILHGRNGNVHEFDMFSASAFTVTGVPTDRPVLWINGHSGDDAYGVRVAAAYSGAGRVLCVPDSAAADDGTGTPGNDAMYDAWTGMDNAALFLNGVDWAANVR